MIECKPMENIPAGDNPFHHDHFNMGERIAKNVVVMFDTFPRDRANYLIVVNTETGERVRLAFSPEGTGLSVFETVLNGGV